MMKEYRNEPLLRVARAENFIRAGEVMVDRRITHGQQTPVEQRQLTMGNLHWQRKAGRRFSEATSTAACSAQVSTFWLSVAYCSSGNGLNHGPVGAGIACFRGWQTTGVFHVALVRSSA
jgi:hypothetical protein